MTEFYEDRVKPVCPSCRTEDNMAGTNQGPIFCVTCGAQFKNAMDLWLKMKRQIVARRWRNMKKKKARPEPAMQISFSEEEELIR